MVDDVLAVSLYGVDVRDGGAAAAVLMLILLTMTILMQSL